MHSQKSQEPLSGLCANHCNGLTRQVTQLPITQLKPTVRSEQSMSIGSIDSSTSALSFTTQSSLLALTAGLYLWGLSKNGSGNKYHAAAVQAGGRTVYDLGN